MAAIRKSSRISKKEVVSHKEKKTLVLQKTKKEHTKPFSALKKKTKTLNDTEKSRDTLKITEETQYSILRKFELSKAVEHLKTWDPELGMHLTEQAIANFQERLDHANGANPFQSLSKMIVYQQIHGKAAASIYSKLLKLFNKEHDDTFPTPLEILAAPKERLRTAGLSARKTEYILDLAEKFKTHSITPESFHTMSDQEISKQLCAVKGIGQWTADMFLMFDLHHPDVLPVGDLAIRKGVARHFGLQNLKKTKIFPTAEQMEDLTSLWRPYRSLASWLLWRISDTKVAG